MDELVANHYGLALNVFIGYPEVVRESLRNKYIASFGVASLPQTQLPSVVREKVSVVTKNGELTRHSEQRFDQVKPLEKNRKYFLKSGHFEETDDTNRTNMKKVDIPDRALFYLQNVVTCNDSKGVEFYMGHYKIIGQVIEDQISDEELTALYPQVKERYLKIKEPVYNEDIKGISGTKEGNGVIVLFGDDVAEFCTFGYEANNGQVPSKGEPKVMTNNFSAGIFKQIEGMMKGEILNRKDRCKIYIVLPPQGDRNDTCNRFKDQFVSRIDPFLVTEEKMQNGYSRRVPSATRKKQQKAMSGIPQQQPKKRYQVIEDQEGDELSEDPPLISRKKRSQVEEVKVIDDGEMESGDEEEADEM